MTRTDCCHGCGKAVAINRFEQHASPRNLLMDTLDGVGVSISGDEDDRCLAYLAKPPSGVIPTEDSLGNQGGIWVSCPSVGSFRLSLSTSHY